MELERGLKRPFCPWPFCTNEEKFNLKRKIPPKKIDLTGSKV